MAGAAYGAVTFLLTKIESLVSREYGLLAGIDKAVEELRREFQTIQAFLQEADARGQTNEQVRVWVSQVRDLAYDIEDALDMFTFHTSVRSFHLYPEFLQLKKRHSVAVLIQEINAKLSGVRATRERYRQLGTSPAPSLADVASQESFTTHFNRVAPLFETGPLGIERSVTELTAWARFGEPRLRVRFVVGMGGLGKTLLAKQVFEAAKRSFEFDCWGWIQISRSQSKEQVLWTMLKRLFESRHEPIPPEFHTINVVQLMEKLANFLNEKKYIIVFDDLWNRDIWESIKCALPTGNHSRIIITTRRGDIAHFCSYDQSTEVYDLKPLTSSKSQELFFRKAFPSTGECPSSGLLDWARKFLTQCEGWPLGIVTIGKVVSKIEQTSDAWRQLHDSLGSEMENGGRISSITRVLSASYSDLPYYLKYCLLYFSVFPEHYSIKRRRLIRMWISEGLVKEETGKTPEEVGHNYLEELTQRNLVLVNEVDFDGRIKTCRVHRLLHKIIVSISKEENFCRTSSEETELNYERVRRLSVRKSRTGLLGTSFPCARSFFVFEIEDLTYSKSQSILSCFSILKVLDLEGAPLEKFPTAILNLVLLKYLSLRNTSIRRLPRSISKLQNLETLDLKQTFVTSVPAKIFRLRKLRHLLIYHYSIGIYNVTIDSVQGFRASSSIGKLASLQKLTFLNPNRDVGILVALKNLTNLKKLGIVNLRQDEGKHLCYSIETMQNLQTLDISASGEYELLDLNAIQAPPMMLQRLYLKGKLRNSKLPNWVSSLHDLVRIVLKWSKLDSTQIDALADLPNLMEIQLVDAYQGKKLVFSSGKFQNLRVLTVEKLEFLEEIVIENGSLGKLQSVVMKQCRMMEKVPEGIEKLSEMKELQLYDMAEVLVNQIQFDGASRQLVNRIPFICAYSLDSAGYWRPKVLS
ncbi:Disease resistance protein RPM1 [Linum perenne]